MFDVRRVLPLLWDDASFIGGGGFYRSFSGLFPLLDTEMPGLSISCFSVTGWGRTRAILLHMQGNDMIL